MLAQFDDVAYSKGGSILKMIINSIGENRYQNGMKKYLKENSFGNTDGQIWFRYSYFELKDHIFLIEIHARCN